MSTPLTIALIVGGGFLGFVLWIVVLTILRERKLAKLPPPPAFRCPSCGSEQIDVLSSGLWDGRDAQGRSTSGGFEYGLCKHCGSRCARFVDDQPFIPTDEQWQSHFGPLEKMRRDRENWPFESEMRNESSSESARANRP